MTPAPRRRKTAVPSVERSVKATVVVDVDTHARWAAAAALAGVDRSAWAAGVIKEALRGVIVVDRRKTGEPVTPPSSAGTSSQD